MKIAAIEAGGTKFVCGIVDEVGTVLDRVSIPTTTPDETMKKVITYFKDKEFQCMGVGSFGPVDLDQKSSTYGYITSTPKVKWVNYNIIGTLKEYFSCPIGFDTDVNAAALAEVTFGAAKNANSCIYLTVGTGIGGGAVINGESIKGLMHPEMGHILVKRHPKDNYHGFCPYHQDCLEGLAAGPAIEKRFGKPGIELSENAEVWDIESYYLAQALMNYLLIVSPEKIILGGGVMHQKGLHKQIHQKLLELLNGYLDNKQILSEEYIVAPELGDNAGLIGSGLLGIKAFNS